MHNKPTFYIIFICTIIILSSIRFAEAECYDKFTHNDPDNLTAIWTTRSFSDGTILLNFVKFKNSTCIEPIFYYRIIHLNGSIAPLTINIPDIEEFNFCKGIYGNPYYNTHTLSSHYFLITYLESHQIGDVKYYQRVGSLFNLHGEFINKINITELLDFPTNTEITKNINPEDGFYVTNIVSLNNDQEWITFKAPNENGEIEKISNGSLPKVQSSISFTTIDGGYATAYVLNKTYTVGTFTDNVDPMWQCYIQFLRPKSNKYTKPVLIYQTTLQLQSMGVGSCHALLDSTGHACFIILEKPENLTEPTQKVHVKVSFLLSGSVIEVQKFDYKNETLLTNAIAPLPYGGYLLTISILKDNEDTRRVLASVVNKANGEDGELQQVDILRDVELTDIFDVFPNNTFWAVSTMTDTNWTYVSTPLPKFLGDDSGYENPKIESTYPPLNDNTVPYRTDHINITLKQPIKLSQANVSIYQKNGDNNILRQTVSSQSIFTSISNEGYTVNIRLFESTFNRPGEKYFVKVDNNFIVDAITNEPVLGIKPGIWMFDLAKRNSNPYADSVTGFVRLTKEGTSYFKSLNEKDQGLFFDQMQDEFNKILPLEPKRISNTQETQSDTKFHDQILLAFDIESVSSLNSSLPSVKEITDDLNTFIKNKWYTPLSNNNLTLLLDDNYGFQVAVSIKELIKQNQWEFISTIITIAIICLFIMISMILDTKCEGNIFAIVNLILAVSDLISNIAFVHFHGNDIPSLFIWSLLTVIISTVFNFTLAVKLIIQEKKDVAAVTQESEFKIWSKEHNTITTNIITLLAMVDVEVIKVLRSKFAGLPIFTAPPFSDETNKWLSISSYINLILKDIPLFIIQVIYINIIISWNFIPFFTLIITSVTLFVALIDKLYDLFGIIIK